RETEEETGYRVRITGLVGIYTDPRHVIVYSDGEVRSQFSICMRGTLTGGVARTSAESSEVVWQQVDRLGELAIHPSMRLRIAHAVDRARTEPYLPWRRACCRAPLLRGRPLQAALDAGDELPKPGLGVLHAAPHEVPGRIAVV